MPNKVSKKKEEGMAPASKRRKAVERTATFGLILIAVGLLGPFTNLMDADYVRFFKWIYAPGALIFTIARVVGSTDQNESMRIRRLRRMEFWAGVAFCIGAFFWFYNEDRYSFYLENNVGTMTVLRESIYFTLAGAVIQVMAVFALSRRLKKEGKGEEK